MRTTALVMSLCLFAVGANTAMAQSEAPPSPYTSEMRDTCESELLKDAAWRADLRSQLRLEVHEEDADLMLTNRRHVVFAYGAIMAMLMGLVVMMGIKTSRQAEALSRLEKDLQRAIGADEGAKTANKGEGA